MFNELKSEFTARGASFIKAVDISMLTPEENQGMNSALIIGMVLSPSYINHFSKENTADYSELSQKERSADGLADFAAEYFTNKGYRAFSQSSSSQLTAGTFDTATKKTVLPNKKIALLAGLGWIGKSNLLITGEYGSALCISTVLTNAPLPKMNEPMLMPKCGDCTVCQDICPAKVIHGVTWGVEVDRDQIVDVYHCRACLKCLAHCVWTQKYSNLPTQQI